mmetsp:Transcript_31184/g.85487  ORF Transcript_31184/g.85487 Transcript_31184/m.85487 type:complete len:223 (+) Transcript_31184:52-720(+)
MTRVRGRVLPACAFPRGSVPHAIIRVSLALAAVGLAVATTSRALASFGIGRTLGAVVAMRRCRRDRDASRRVFVDPRIKPPPDGLVEFDTPQPLPLLQLATVLLCTLLPFAYWWYIVVPTKRQEVARSKRRGEIREYLEDLSATPATERKAEKWLYDKYLREGKLTALPRSGPGVPEAVSAFEDGLQEALPGGGFWSFDNPVFVYLVLFGAFCVVTLATHPW